MADDRNRSRSSEDRIRDAWKRLGSEDPDAADQGEPASPSDGTDGLDMAEYLSSLDGVPATEEPHRSAAGPDESPSTAEPVAKTKPIRYDVASVSGGTPDLPPSPLEMESRETGTGRFRRLGWLLAVALFVVARFGLGGDLLGESAGEQAIDSLRVELTAGGVSEESWSCIESGLRSGGYVDILNEASVSEVNEALESPLAERPPELISFLEGFDMYANPARATSCLTEEDWSRFAMSAFSSDDATSAGFVTASPGDGFPVGVAGVVVGSVTLDADVVGAVMMTPGSMLDCNGHSIRGESSQVGVAMADDSTVRNCFLSGFNTGIGLGGTDGAVVENVEVKNSRIGFYLVNGTTNATITTSSATGNEIGFLFERSVSSVRLEENEATRNWRSGFMMGYTDDSILSGNTATGGGSGFWITHSNRNQFVGNTVTGASEWFSIGVFESSTANLFENNEVTGGGVAVAVNSRAAHNEFVGNHLHHNAKGAHVEANSGPGNTFAGNRVEGNSHVGLWDDTTSAADRYTSNVCSLNADADSVPDGLC